MNLIIRDGNIDRYATNEEFSELESTINDDLRRTLIYLSYCNGEKDDLIKTIEQIRKNLSSRNTLSEDLEIALVDDYVVFNLFDNDQVTFNIYANSQSESAEEKLPEIVIMKRDMRSIYFLRKVGASNIVSDKKEYLSLYQANYEAILYNYSNGQIKKSHAKFDTFIKDELEEPFFKTNQFMNSLNKTLGKIIIFNNEKNK